MHFIELLPYALSLTYDGYLFLKQSIKLGLPVFFTSFSTIFRAWVLNFKYYGNQGHATLKACFTFKN